MSNCRRFEIIFSINLRDLGHPLRDALATALEVFTLEYNPGYSIQRCDSWFPLASSQPQAGAAFGYPLSIDSITWTYSRKLALPIWYGAYVL